MRKFEYMTPETVEEAIQLLGDSADAAILAGGTDLLGQMKAGIGQPERLVSLRRLPGLRTIQSTPDGGVEIGTAATLHALQASPLLQEYRALQEAIRRTATPQIRSIGTLGGNLCQRPRCWYYRNPHFGCLRRHGEVCSAMGGEDRYHAIFGGHRCFMVHPSDLAPVLIAFDAEAEVTGPNGTRRLPLHRFFVGPEESMTRETALEAGDLLTGVLLPALPAGSRSTYVKVSERKATDFALTSLAVHLVMDGNQVARARLVLGGVAPVPWQVGKVERTLEGEEFTDDLIQHVSELAVVGARPLRHNRYKLRLVRGVVRRALLDNLLSFV